jgi:hypothetical protein
VDELTANALNRLLAEYSAADDETTAPPAYQVTGTVRLADGYPAGGVTVAVFDRDLRSEQPLGRCNTDRQGFYQIRYDLRRLRKPDKGTADLGDYLHTRRGDLHRLQMKGTMPNV